MIDLDAPEIWFVCGSQHLYGPGPLQQVAANAREIGGGARAVDETAAEDCLQGATDDARRDRASLCLEANSDPNCAGLILWMHTFSPSKMWIRGLNALQKPFVHLHTQFNPRPAVGRRSTWIS